MAANDLLNGLHTEVGGLQSSACEGFQQAPEPSARIRTPIDHDEEHLINLFYSHFHPTHPILIPRSRYNAQGYPPYLRLLVQLIGSQYAPLVSSDALRNATDAALSTVSERSVSLVQSLLLYAIALHAWAERAKAVGALAKASSLGIELGMNRAEFASAHGTPDALVEESLRRTWWELYVIDGYFAALYRQTGFQCNTVELTAYLPCDEGIYLGGAQSPQHMTIGQFDNRLFLDDAPHFASACYRIEAIRILARVIATTSAGDGLPDDVQAVDNAIAAWKFHLPDEKAGIVDHFGEVDQMIFQAYAFIYCASILLHFPRSELLLTLPTAADIACAARMTQASPTSAQHAIKAIAASKGMSDLAALPVDKHSPLFVCDLVFSCIVQLSACSAHSRSCLIQLSACSAHSRNCLSQHRDRVALMTGVLKDMGRSWAISQEVLPHLNRVANGIFNSHQDMGSMTSQISDDSGVGFDMMSNDMPWFDVFFAGVMNDQDAMDGET